MNKVALVLGASEGIGFACANKLLIDGKRVCIVSRNTEKLEKAFNTIPEKYKGNLIYFACDISDKNSAMETSKFIQNNYGSVDILVNSNGGPKTGNLLNLTDEDWEDGFNKFAMPIFRFIKYFSTDMIRNGWGRIITIGSIAAKEPIENLDISNFVRSGMLGLHKSLARDLAKHNINVHMVQPGSILTSRTKQRILQRAEDLSISYEDSEKISLAKIPKGKIGSADDVGNLIRFLCSDESEYLTGTSINIDGGMSNSI